MSEKSLVKNINNCYGSTVIDICKLVKPHASNILLLSNNKVLMQPMIAGIRNYMILNSNVDYSTFIYTYFTISEISKANTKFRKTKSEISWETDKGTEYLVVKNDDMEPVKSLVMTDQSAVNSLFAATYNRIPDIDNPTIDNVIIDEPNSMYIDLGTSFIDDMVNKKLCEIRINNQSILISRPFLGDLKKTQWVGYRVVDEDDFRLVIKFKQVEKIGSIYTYAAFLKY